MYQGLNCHCLPRTTTCGYPLKEFTAQFLFGLRNLTYRLPAIINSIEMTKKKMGRFIESSRFFFGEWMTPKLLTPFVFTFHLIHLLLSKVACLPMPLQLIGFNLVVRTRSFEGVVGEILGDGILAFWNTPDVGHPDTKQHCRWLKEAIFRNQRQRLLISLIHSDNSKKSNKVW